MLAILFLVLGGCGSTAWVNEASMSRRDGSHLSVEAAGAGDSEHRFGFARMVQWDQDGVEYNFETGEVKEVWKDTTTEFVSRDGQGPRAQVVAAFTALADRGMAEAGSVLYAREKAKRGPLSVTKVGDRNETQNLSFQTSSTASPAQMQGGQKATNDSSAGVAADLYAGGGTALQKQDQTSEGSHAGATAGSESGVGDVSARSDADQSQGQDQRATSEGSNPDIAVTADGRVKVGDISNRQDQEQGQDQESVNDAKADGRAVLQDVAIRGGDQHQDQGLESTNVSEGSSATAEADVDTDASVGDVSNRQDQDQRATSEGSDASAESRAEAENRNESSNQNSAEGTGTGSASSGAESTSN
ncbi:MAG: hypothetical protein WD049_10465 [Candidatus Paceibacterota bacterium]